MLSLAVDLIPGARRRALTAANLGPRMVTRLEHVASQTIGGPTGAGSPGRWFGSGMGPNGPAQVPDLTSESWRCAGLWARRREGLTRDFQAGMGAEREQMTFGFCPSLGPSGQDASCATRGAVAAGSSPAVPARHSRLGPSSEYRAPLRPSRFALLRKPRAEAAPLWTPSSQIERQPRNERRLAMRGWCGA